MGFGVVERREGSERTEARFGGLGTGSGNRKDPPVRTTGGAPGEAFAGALKRSSLC